MYVVPLKCYRWWNNAATAASPTVVNSHILFSKLFSVVFRDSIYSGQWLNMCKFLLLRWYNFRSRI